MPPNNKSRGLLLIGGGGSSGNTVGRGLGGEYCHCLPQGHVGGEVQSAEEKVGRRCPVCAHALRSRDADWGGPESRAACGGWWGRGRRSGRRATRPLVGQRESRDTGPQAPRAGATSTQPGDFSRSVFRGPAATESSQGRCRALC